MEKKIIKQNNILIEVDKDTSKKNLALANSLIEMKKLEGLVSLYNEKIKFIKDSMKESPYDKISIVSKDDVIECTITKYSRTTSTLDKEKVKAAIANEAIYESCLTSKTSESVMVKIK